MRNLRDDCKKTTTALPPAGANATTAPLDLEQPTADALESVSFEISVPATPGLVENKSIVLTAFDGATAADLAAIVPQITHTITGKATGGAPTVVVFRLPPTARRFVAVNIAVESNGGNLTALDAVASLLF